VSAPAQILDALREVYDPCGQAWNRPISLVDLGLVREVRLDPDGAATVRISLTAPFCMAVATIMQAVEQRVGALPGVRAVHVDIDTETPWVPELMTGDGRRALHRQRADDRGRVGVPLPRRSP
jgi:metal-sulfur cluster biosynthetic enzyme